MQVSEPLDFSVETLTYQRTETTTNSYGEWINAPVDFHVYVVTWRDDWLLNRLNSVEVHCIKDAFTVISQIQDDYRKWKTSLCNSVDFNVEEVTPLKDIDF